MITRWWGYSVGTDNNCTTNKLEKSGAEPFFFLVCSGSNLFKFIRLLLLGPNLSTFFSKGLFKGCNKSKLEKYGRLGLQTKKPGSATLRTIGYGRT